MVPGEVELNRSLSGLEALRREQVMGFNEEQIEVKCSVGRRWIPNVLVPD